MDVSESDLSTTVLGDRINLPVMAAPAGGMWEAHPDAEVAVARAASAAGTLMALATGSSRSIQEVAKATSGPLWYQLYHIDDEVTELLVTRAKAAGYSAVCLTVDGVGGRRKERDARNDYQPRADKAWADLHERPELLERVTKRAVEPLHGADVGAAEVAALADQTAPGGQGDSDRSRRPAVRRARSGWNRSGLTTVAGHWTRPLRPSRPFRRLPRPLKAELRYTWTLESDVVRTC